MRCQSAEKPKLAVYWAAACGGCEIAVANLHEKILDVDANFDFFFCPCLLDTKKSDVEALPDKAIALTFFNGAIRNNENEEMAHLLRKKSRMLIAFGSCAYEGCVPGLANLYSKEEILKTVYRENYTIDNPAGVIPHPETAVNEGMLTIPVFYDRILTLSDVVEVDYFIPGCPPEPHQIWNVIESVISNQPLPAKSAVIGAGISSVCNECKRTKEDKRIKRFYRTFEIIPDREKCLLEQGIICMGIATRDGCGALCPEVNMPCTGCYGPPDCVSDQGAKMTAALGSIIDIGDTKGLSEDEINKKMDDIIGSICDPAGTFYKYSLPKSVLKGAISK
ncbi:MAG: NADH:ubiquinone oxidoreductase [Nitrospirae bacterium]|nr:NADH:ubiquinone oxidoreductase [Nitrospirota bacterium]